MKKIRKVSMVLLSILLLAGCNLANAENFQDSTQSENPKQSQNSTEQELLVHFIDVGQGDSILLQYEGENVLIDTGTENQYPNLAGYLEQIGVDAIDQLVVTHPDADHMGGADCVIEDYSVDQIYMTTYKSSSNEYKEMLQAVKDNGVERINVVEGDEIPVGGLNASVLAADSKASDSNASSIVMKLEHGENSFLFTGDAPAKVEDQVMEKYDVDVDVLKVAHHGSDYSSPIAYIKETSPEYAVISVGKDNKYGHPVKTVLSRLEKYSSYIYRTDECGTIIITSTGEKLSCKTSKLGDASTVKTNSGNSDKNETKSESSNTNKTTSEKKEESNNTKKKVIGNSSTKKYHTPSCSSLPKEENRVYFKNDAEAEDEGYEACKRCH